MTIERTNKDTKEYVSALAFGRGIATYVLILFILCAVNQLLFAVDSIPAVFGVTEAGMVRESVCPGQGGHHFGCGRVREPRYSNKQQRDQLVYNNENDNSSMCVCIYAYTYTYANLTKK